MKHRGLIFLLGIILTMLLCLPVLAAEEVTVHIDGQPLETTGVSSRVIGGSTYVPLVDFAAAIGDPSVSWDGTRATVTAGGVTIVAAPGECYFSAGERCLYVPQGVKLVEGRTMVPVTSLASVYGLGVAWEGETATVRLTSGEGEIFSGYDADDLYWLSRIISAESRGEPLQGQIAVGNVVLNRVASPQFPDSIQGVVFDTTYGLQFEPVGNGTIYQEPTQSAVVAAKLALEGANVVGGCLYFYNPSLSQSTWFDANRVYYTTIGGHAFYL